MKTTSDLILSEEHTRGTQDIFISNIDQNKPKLKYLDPVTNLGVEINCNSSQVRPIFASELGLILSSRDWNISNRRSIAFTESDELEALYCRSNSYGVGTNPIDTISEDTERFRISDTDQVPESTQLNFFTKYEDIITEMENEIYLFNSSISRVDILNNIETIELIVEDSDIYTDTVNLDSSLQVLLGNGKKTATVSLSIQYSIGDNIYTKHSTFSAVGWSNDSYFCNNLIEVLDGNVEIEYLDFEVRIFSKSPTVQECIINACTLTVNS